MKTTFYISPFGNDQNDGSLSKPWATLKGARDKIREFRNKNKDTETVEVIVKYGHYHLSEPVEFLPEDSDIIFRAEGKDKPIFDGSVELKGFREEKLPSGARVWTLDIPEVKSGRWYFKSLFVNGGRRPRARLPKFSPDAAGVKNLFRIGEIRFPEKRHLFDGDNMFKPQEGDFQNWASLPDAEIVILHYWIETRLGTPQYNPKTGWVTCPRRSVFNLYESFNPRYARYYIDNLKEALSDPGEWYLDRNEGRLYYIPKDNEKLEDTIIRAPKVKTFIRAWGSAYNHGHKPHDPYGVKSIENLHFSGLCFENSDWYAPTAEFLPHDRLHIEDVPIGGAPQAAIHVPATIEFQWAKDCSVNNCEIRNIGFTGIAFEKGCRDCSVTHSIIQEVGAGGIKVFGAELDGCASDRTGQIIISDNRITDIGRVFQQGNGILISNAFKCVVSHNEVARTCHTGISCGWSWGYRDTVSRDNIIEKNLIHDIGQTVLSDMGGIYLLGVQPGTVVRGNHIYNVSSADYGGWGIYPDEGSSHMLIEENYVHDIQGAPFRIHFSRELVVRNNVFARSREEGLIGIGRVEDHISASVFSNVLIGPAAGVYEGGYAGDVRNAFRSNSNLIWFPPDGKIPFSCHYDGTQKDAENIDMEAWLATGNDKSSIIADPKAIETKNNIQFPPDSPVFKIGFRQCSWADCGPRSQK